jgi:hypothetical protein
MKTLTNIQKIKTLNLSILALLFLASCSSTRYATNAPSNDDAYYTRNNNVSNSVPNEQQPVVSNTSTVVYNYSKPVRKTVAASEDSKFDQSNQNYQNQEVNNNQPPDSTNRNPRYSTSETYQDSAGTYVTNNYFYDDYYDYGYASRIRRFHHPEWGYNYYDDYFTNMYWYNHDPLMWGTSIYMGYNWMWPSYSYFRPGWYMDFNFGFGLGIGWGYSSMWWDPFYSSYYPYYYGYPGYYGYNDYAYYNYNSYDRGGSYRYHQHGRAPLSGYGSGHSRRQDGSVAGDQSFGAKVQNYLATQKSTSNQSALNSKSLVNNGSIINNTSKAGSLNSMNINNNLNVNNTAKSATGNINNQKLITKSANNNNPASKYSKPNSLNINNNIKNSSAQNQIAPKNNIQGKPNQVLKSNKPLSAQQYNKYGINNNKYYNPAPKYAKPKTYISPGYSQPKSGQYYSRPNGYTGQGNRQLAIPRNNTKNEYSMPKGGNNQGTIRSNPAPSRSFNAPAPSHNYSAPAPSHNYSAPAPSRSYSAPAPSNSGGAIRGGGSNLGSGSGGGSGGGRRGR